MTEQLGVREHRRHQVPNRAAPIVAHVLDVHAETTAEAPNLLLIRINYRIRATNAIGTLVYPSYITEGR